MWSDHRRNKAKLAGRTAGDLLRRCWCSVLGPATKRRRRGVAAGGPVACMAAAQYTPPIHSDEAIDGSALVLRSPNPCRLPHCSGSAQIRGCSCSIYIMHGHSIRRLAYWPGQVTNQGVSTFDWQHALTT
jgi:hypothetical protein